MFTGVILRNYSNEAILHINQHPNTSRYHKVEALQELWEAKGFHEKKKLLRHQPNEGQQYQQRRCQDGWNGQNQGSGSCYQIPRREGEPSVHKGGNEHPGQGWGGPRKSQNIPGRVSLTRPKALARTLMLFALDVNKLVTLSGSVLPNS